jgi:hypothetical protein
LPLPEDSWKKYVKATAEDEELQEVIKLIRFGWPANKNELKKPELSVYWTTREDLHLHKELIFRRQQIVVPKGLRKCLLQQMHLDHSGLVKTLSKAREAVYWPGISSDIKKVVETCQACQSTGKSNSKEPLICRALPDYPFQRVAMDYFECMGKTFLVVIDAYSHWFNVYPVFSTDFSNLKTILTSHFTEHGTPEEICSDNGPPFQSHKFKEFCKAKEIKHTTSSPRYPQSNGLAERAVQTAKKMVIKCNNTNTPLDVALMEYRNAPFACDLPSPSELALGRKLRTTFPYQNKNLVQRFHPLEEVVKKYNEYKIKQKNYYDQGSRPLKPIEKGMSVLIQSEGKWSPARVQEKLSQYPRSYTVITPNGSIIRRNRKQLKEWKGTTVDEQVIEENEDNSKREDSEQRNEADKQQQDNQESNGKRCVQSRYGRTIRPPSRFGFP